MAAPKLRFNYAGIRVRSLPRSLRFYRALGFRIEGRGKMEHGGEWVHLTLPPSPQRLELNYYPKGNRFAEPYRRGSELDHLGLSVDDVGAWAAKARRSGWRIAADIRETRERLLYVKDPDGIWIEICGPPAPNG